MFFNCPEWVTNLPTASDTQLLGISQKFVTVPLTKKVCLQGCDFKSKFHGQYVGMSSLVYVALLHEAGLTLPLTSCVL